MIRLRRIAFLLLAAGVLLTGCAKNSESPPTQKKHPDLRIDPPVQVEHDEDGYPIERNRPVGNGSTRTQADGKEELLIPVREAYFEDHPVMPRVVGP